MKKLLTGFLSISIILSSTAAGIPAACALEEVTAEAGYDYALSTDAISDADTRESAKLEYNQYGFAYENFGNKIYENQVKSNASTAVSGNMSDGYTAFNVKSGAAGVGWDGGWTIIKDSANSAAYANWILDYSTYWNGEAVKELEKRSCVRFNGTSMHRKLLNPVDLSVDGDYFIRVRGSVGKKVTDTVKDQGGLWLELLDDSGNAPVSFGANVPEGAATYMIPYVSGSGYDSRTSGDMKVTYSQWYVFLMHIKSQSDDADKLSFVIYPEADPSAAEVITTEVDSSEVLGTFRFGNPSNSYMQVQDVGIDCFNDSITGSPFTADEVETAIIDSSSVDAASEVYSLLPETATKTWYKLMYKTILDDTYNNIAVTETSEEDARESFAFLGSFKNDYDWSSKADELKALCEQNGWDAATAKLVKATPGDESIVYADTVETIELVYDYLLDESGSVTLLQGNEAVDTECTVSGNTVTLAVDGAVDKGVTCVVSTENLTDYKGDAVPGISFNLSMLPVLNIEDGGMYTQGAELIWPEPEAGVCTVTLRQSGKNKETIISPHTLTEAGDYTLVMLCEAEGGFAEERTVEFTVNAAVKPQAKNVSVIGDAVTGKTVTGDYDWYSANENEKEKDSKYVWYRSVDSSSASAYEKIADTKSYKLTTADENHWLKFAVIPGSDSPMEPVGEETLSEPFAAAFNPVVKSLGIEGTIAKDSLLESKYEYYDENGDAEDKSKTVVKWYMSGDKESAGEEITSKLDSDGKMKITEELFERYVYITVSPAAVNAPVSGETYTSVRYLMPTAPVITDVKITGTSKVGSTLTADYKYYDANGDIEGATVIEWKDVDTDEVVGTGRSLALKSNMQGKVLYASVKGVSQKAPFDSLNVANSEGVTISAAASTSNKGGSKNVSPGSYAGSSSGSVVTTPPVVQQPAEQQKGFTDISGHWAEQNVLSLEKAGIISTAALYRPNDSISRAELVKLAVLANGLEPTEYKNIFGDVSADDWFAGYVQAAVDAGIISLDTAFRPNDAISREETAKIFAIMSGVTTEQTADFADMDLVSEWAIPFVNAVYEAKIFSGDTNGCFNPLSQLTRAEAAAIIDRLIN